MTAAANESLADPAAATGAAAAEGSKPRVRTGRLRARLRRLARDLWWSWNECAQRPFAALDPEAWDATRHDPLAVLAGVDDETLRLRGEEPDFMAMVEFAERTRRESLQAPSWFDAKHGAKSLRVAYFCSEFALHESLPQYAGGLGVLAGDHLKSASDLGVPVIGVGLLYREGYYRQEVRADGTTRVRFLRLDARCLPLRDTGVEVDCPLGRRTVRLRVWRLRLGRTRIYLLDANLRANRPRDRALTRGLYRGDPRRRLRQQVLLGVGGMLALEAMKEPVTVLHLNEGHAAFAALALAARLVRNGHSLEEALVLARQATVFTTHTPVPAGHDRYEPRLVLRALRQVTKAAKMSGETLLSLGREHGEAKDPFCLTALALRLAEHCNGVAALHGRVTREMWMHLFERQDPAQVPVGHITNGVHMPSWTDPVAREFWREEAGIDLSHPAVDRDPWAADAARVDPARLWALRCRWRTRLVMEVRRGLANHARRCGADPAEVLRAALSLDERALTIGFARRFATYKRAPLIFTDPDRLARLLGDDDRPVQIIFAGKAHPADRDGQAFLRRVHAITQDPRFRGRVALLEEYDMGLARLLVSGCDVWLNTPLRPHEASGTSGMKVAVHGGINLSIPDGWWPEGFDGRNGWTIGDGHEPAADPESRQRQDDLDAAALYGLLEREVIPEFYERSAGGTPERWMDRALRSAATIPGRFSSDRMVAEYLVKAYLPAHGAAPTEGA